MNILIIGASGPVGSEIGKHLKKNGHSVNLTYFQHRITDEKSYELDIMNREKTMELIKKINPEIVIHCAALSGVDLAEKNHSLADSITVDGTKNIVKSCEKLGSKIVYVSTSFVYDENIKLNSEESTPKPNTYYGLSKLNAERIVQKSNLENLIIRIDQPYGWITKGQKINSVIRVLQTLKQNKILKEVEDWYNTPTFLPDIAVGIELLIKNNEIGIFNLVGSDFVCRYKWSLMVADIFGLDAGLILPIQSSELNLAVKRPKNNVDNTKLYHKTGFKMKGVKDGLLKMLENRHAISEI